MAEGGYDPCECVCGHEYAMRRLLSFIQMSQSDCTQNQCFSNLFDGSDEDSTWLSQMLIWLLLWVLILLALYLFKPKSLQGKQPPQDQQPRPPLPPPVQ